MANIFLLSLCLASFFALAKAGPLGRKFEAKNSEEDNATTKFEFGDQNGDGQLSFEEFVDLVANSFGYSEGQTEKMSKMPEMREIFQKFDTNADGQLSMGEFKVLYASRDKEIKRKVEIVEFKLMDSNGDGLVDYDEFVDFVAEKAGMDKEERDRLAKSEEMHLAFERMDANGDGKIEMDEVVKEGGNENENENENGSTTQNPSPSTPSTPQPQPQSALATTPISPLPILFPSPEQIFGQIDANDDGFLVYKECMDFVADGMHFSEDQIGQMEESPIPAELFEGIDANGDGQISMEDFVNNYSAFSDKPFVEKMFRMFLDIADENGDGLANYEEFVDCQAEQENLGYQQRNELANDPKMREKFERIDKNGDGQISLEELLAAIYGPFGGTSSEAPSTSTTTTAPEPSTSTQQSTPADEGGESSTTLDPSLLQMQEIFDQFDANNDGQWEFDEALNFYGNSFGMTEERKERVGRSRSFRKIFDRIDVDGNGKLSLAELMKVKEMDKEELVEALFSVVDGDGDGFVDFGELMAFIGDMYGLEEEELEQTEIEGKMRIWFEGMDKNGDGKLDLEECREGMGMMGTGMATAKMVKNAMEEMEMMF